MALVSGRAVIVRIALRAVITARSALGRRIGITFIMLLLQCFLDNTTTTMYLQKERKDLKQLETHKLKLENNRTNYSENFWHLIS